LSITQKRLPSGPRHFALLVVRVEIEVDPAAMRALLVSGLQREVRSFAGRIAKDDPSARRRVPWDIAECLLPELGHALEFVAML